MSRMSRVTELPIEVDPFTLNLELFVSVQARLGMYSSWDARKSTYQKHLISRCLDRS